MNSELSNSVQTYIKKVEAFNSHLLGDRWSEKEIENTEKKLGIVLPFWYKDLLINFPLRGMDIGIQLYEPEEDYNGVEYIVFEGIDVVECLDAVPGCEILERGYICIGGDTSGSGDPFFISLHEGENPPVYQVYHDVGEEADEILKEGKVLVSLSLATFFKNAIIDFERTADIMKVLDFEQCHNMIVDGLKTISYGYVYDYYNWVRRHLKNANIIHDLNLSYEEIENAKNEFSNWFENFKTNESIPQDLQLFYFRLVESNEETIKISVTGSYQYDKEHLETACECDFEPEKRWIELSIGRKLYNVMKSNFQLGVYFSVTLTVWLISKQAKNHLEFKKLPIVVGFRDGDRYKI